MVDWVRFKQAVIGSILGMVMVGALVSSCSARMLWEEGGFALESGGWIDSDSIVEWTGVLCGMTLPDNGWFLIESEGALEFYIPTIGWVLDKGILVMNQCKPLAETDKRACCLIPKHRCASEKDRVMLVVKIPKMFPSKEDRPTKARWIQRKVTYHVEEN